jgi:predicted dehydrogenase
MGNPSFEAVSGSTASYIGRSESNIITSLAESGAPAGVFNAREFSPEEFEVEEFAAGSIRLSGGIRINFKISWAVNLPNEFGISMAGSKAGLSIPKMEMYSTMGRYQVDIKPRIFKQGKYEGKDFSGHFYLLEDAVNFLMGEGKLPVQPEETLNVAAIIDAFYISAREGREVSASEIVK